MSETSRSITGQNKINRRAFPIPGDLFETMKGYRETAGVTPFMLTVCALSIYVSKITGQTTIPMAVTDPPRPFILRVGIQNNMPFRQLVKDTTGELNHMVSTPWGYPFDSAVEELAERRGADTVYLMDISVSGRTGMEMRRNVTDRVFPGRASAALTIHVHHRRKGKKNGRMELEYGYHTTVYSEQDIPPLHRGLITILTDALASPDKETKDFELLSNEEKHKILYDFNDTDRDYPHDKTIPQLFEIQVDQTPDNEALVFDGETLNYRELDLRANRTAHYLVTAKGVQPGEPVGILMERSFDLVIGMLGILKAGGAYAPINPGFPIKRIERIINDAAIGVMLSQKRFVNTLNRLQWECTGFHTFLCLDSYNINGEDETEKSGLMNIELWKQVGETTVDDVTGGGRFSSYTGEPMTREEMDEYGDNISAKLEPLLHEKIRVLEIGVASGVSMHRIAPKTALYYGTDPSPVNIEKNMTRAKKEGLNNIKLAALAAHEMDRITEKNFDLVIVNNVIQDFHGHNHLRKVIARAVGLMRETGRIFIGDIMDADLKKDLIADRVRFKQANQGKGYTTQTDLSEELFVSRGFFLDLRAEMPAVAGVEFSGKIHTIENELTRYRYDALLEIDKTRAPDAAPVVKRKHQDDLNTLARWSDHRLNRDIPPDTAAYVIYTSGSTGMPKGALVPHRGIASLTTTVKDTMNINASDRVVQFAAAALAASVWEIYMTLLSGAALYLVDGDTIGDHQKFTDYLNQNRITIATLPPMYANHLERSRVHSLRVLITAGSAAEPALVERWRKKLLYINSYGPTESTTCSSMWTAGPDDKKIDTVSIGSPVNNLRIYITAGDMSLLPVGVPGELCVTGAPVAAGYLNRPELTAEKFIKTPASFLPSHPPPNTQHSTLNTHHSPLNTHHSTLYKTGDSARRLPDGNIEFLGRIDSQVKIRGFRIEPGEIEARLRRHEAVKDAVVIARENARKESYLCAYFTAERETAVSQLRDFIAAELPDYMIPGYFIPLAGIPLNINGKVDITALPEPMSAIAAEGYAAPENDTQKKLAALWAELLHLPENIIGIDADFFELGGHSLTAAVLMTRVHKGLDVKISIADVFESKTIRALAAHADAGATDAFAAIEPAEAKDHYPQTAAQRQLFSVQQMRKADTGYNIQLMDIHDDIQDTGRVEAALKQLIQRYEILRTSFHMVDGRPVQRVHRDPPFKVECWESSEGRACTDDRRSRRGRESGGDRRAPSPDRRRQTEAYHDTLPGGRSHINEPSVQQIVADFVKPFDLGRPPLMRVGLINVRGSRQVHMLDVHQIIADGISIRIMMEEFRALYRGGQLPPPAIQYKDFAQWQARGPQRETIEKQGAYRLNHFAGEVPVFDLPIDFPRPAVRSFEGGVQKFSIGKKETRRLHDLAGETGVTLYMILLAAYTIMWGKISGREDIVVGSVTAGRDRADLFGVIGMFVKTLVLRNFPGEDKTIGRFLAEVKESVIAAIDNQDYPYEELVSRTAQRTDTTRNPLFDVFFGWYNEFDSDDERRQVLIPGGPKPYDFKLSRTRFDISFNGVESRGMLYFSIEYAVRLFKKETIQRLTRYFKKIVSALSVDTGRAIGAVDFIPEEEKCSLLYGFNDTGTPYPETATIHQLFEEQVERTPGGAAAIYRDRHITYGELNRRANQTARMLRDQGIVPGTIAAVIMRRSMEMIIGLLGILKSGAAYLPIDPQYPAERVDYLLKHSGVKILIHAGDIEPAPTVPRIIDINGPAVFTRDTSNPGVIMASRRAAYVIYTSGAGGRPKGVLVEHRGVVNALVCRRKEYPIDPSVTALQLFSYAVNGFVTGFFTPVISGAKVILISEDHLKDIAKIRDVIVTQRVSHFTCVPPLYAAIIDCLTAAETASLRVVTLTGGTVPAELTALSREKNETLEIAQEYGVTEASGMSTLSRHQEASADIGIGKPIWNTRIYITDPRGNIRPIGGAGELCITGSGIARGYVNNPELTHEKFSRPPYAPFTAPIFHTGDSARRLPDGNIRFLGRHAADPIC